MYSLHIHRGASLIEILISFFIISVMLLGFDAMQMLSLREAKSAYYFAVAVQQLDAMIERLNVSQGKNSDEPFRLWNEKNHEVLPQGRGEVSGVYPHFIVSIFWGDITQKECHQNKMGQSGCLYIAVTM